MSETTNDKAYKRSLVSASATVTFEMGRDLANEVRSGVVILLYGGLGAGKTLLTKGILAGLGYDGDGVTSPSFTLVNLYKTEKFDVYHIDLWRLDGAEDPAEAVGLGEILEAPNSIAIIEWADRLRSSVNSNTIRIDIDGNGDEPRRITIEEVREPWLTKA